MKLSSYCSHDLKMIIFYRGHARLIFTSYDPLSFFQQFVLSLQVLLQFSLDFAETSQLFFPLPEYGHIIQRSHITDFYLNYRPLSALAILSIEILISTTPPSFIK